MSAAEQATSSVLKTLATLKIGEPLLFVLLQEVRAGFPPLLVQSAAKDPTGERLLTLTGKVPDAGRDHVSGTGFFDDRGRLNLAAPGLDARWLERIADWVRAGRDDEPKLRLLHDARLLVDDAFGGPARVIEDPDLWAGAKAVRPKRTGGLAQSAAILRDLSPGARVPFWIGHGAGGPALVVADAESFAATVSNTRHAGQDRDRASIVGVAQRLSSGRVALTAEVDPADLSAALASLVRARGPQHPALWELATARCLRLGADSFEPGAAPFDAPDSATLQKALPQLRKAGGSACAWFTTAGPDGLPYLIVAKTDEALADRVSALEGHGAATRGTLRFPESGPEFLIDRPLKNLAEHVAGWVCGQRFDAPKLTALRGLTAVANTPGGERALSADPARWAPLRKK